MGTAKATLWLCVTAGFGWFAYFAVPSAVAASFMLAQGVVPEWSVKDWANLGGFAIFASAMYFLHRESIKQFSTDMKEEREQRHRHETSMAEHIKANTVATMQLTGKIEEIIRGK